MKKLNVIIGLMSIVLLITVGCREESLQPPVPDAQESFNQVSYEITEEEAIANVLDFVNDAEEVQSRAGKLKTVANALKVRNSNSATSRSTDSDSALNHALMYIINFDNDEGFAVASGDVRIPYKVLALIDKGNMNILVDENGNIVERPAKPTPEFPLTGEGFFTDSQYGDELFINPNTCDFYDPEIDDTMVGNYEMEYIVDSDTTATSSTHDLDNSHSFEPAYLVVKMCLDFGDDVIKDPGRFNYHWNDGSLIHSEDGGLGSWDVSNITKVVREPQPWQIKKQVYPMLGNYANWHQDSPFKNDHPERRAYILFGNKRKAPAGCFPLSIAKVMAKFEFPQSITYNGYNIDWSYIQSGLSNMRFGRHMSKLIAFISNGCDSWYFYNGTFTFPSKAVKFLKFNGFPNVSNEDYTHEKVMTMLDSGLPVVVYAIPGWNVFKSHAWNIDGYKIKYRYIKETYYNGTMVAKVEHVPDECTMMHCDFGWGGSCNGYLVSGVFDLKSALNEFDSGSNNGHKEKYSSYLHIVSYSKPN